MKANNIFYIGICQTAVVKDINILANYHMYIIITLIISNTSFNVSQDNDVMSVLCFSLGGQEAAFSVIVILLISILVVVIIFKQIFSRAWKI